MRRVLFGAVALVTLVAEPALAAAPIPYVYNWSGCYVGVHAGGGWQDLSYTEEVGAASGVGVLGGAQSGCNLQWRQFVIGIEGEFWGSSLYDREYSSSTGGGTFFTDDRRSRNPWDGAVSARAGVAFDRTLIYGKLGVVLGKFDYSANTSSSAPSTDTQSGNALFTGVLLGVGFEYALTDNWTAKLEYNYIDYGTTIVDLSEVSCDMGCVSYADSNAIKESEQLVKIGVNYKFNWGAAEMAPQ